MTSQKPVWPGLPPVMDSLVHALSAFLSVEQIILFGSRARGDYRERSDIDLAISAPHITPQEQIQIADYLEQLPSLLHIDLIYLEEAAAELRYNILQEGKIVYERNTKKPKTI